MAGFRVVLFGTGAFYERYKTLAFGTDTVLALADNDIAKQGHVIDGIPVVAPAELCALEYDFVVLLLSYENAILVFGQIASLGVPKEKILFYDDYIVLRSGGKHRVFAPEPPVKVALVTTDLSYGGGTIALISAARALLGGRFSVTIVTPQADAALVSEVNGYGITVVEYPAFYKMGKDELDWIQGFDFAVVNTFQMIDCAVKISGVVPMLWWLHEPSEKPCMIYPNTLARYASYLGDPRIRRIPVFAVSSVPLRAFCGHFSGCDAQILPYCVKDEAFPSAARQEKVSGRHITFALIAGFSPLKNQTLFLKAAGMLNKARPGLCRFLLVGRAGATDYAKEVLFMAEHTAGVEVRGLLSRQQMKKAYEDEIDVVVCPSQIESLPTVIAEGMMWSKLCICSDNTGMSDYIKDGDNGFLCRMGSPDSLYEKMRYCAEHFDALEQVREQARKTYENNFSMGIFSRRLEKAISRILKDAREGEADNVR